MLAYTSIIFCPVVRHLAIKMQHLKFVLADVMKLESKNPQGAEKKQACQGKARFLVQTHTVNSACSLLRQICGRVGNCYLGEKTCFFAAILVIRGHVSSNRAVKLQPANYQFRVGLGMVLRFFMRVSVCVSPLEL